MIFSLPLTASAAVREHSFNFTEPPTGEGQGYILVEYLQSNGNYYVRCFYWNAVILGSSNIGMNTDTSMIIDISGNTISFKPYYSADYGYCANFSFIDSYDSAYVRYYYRESKSPIETIYSYTFTSSYDIISYKVFGDVLQVNSDFSTTNRDNFNVSWGETKLLLEDLSVLISQMQEALANDEEALELFNKILTNTNDIEALLTSIVGYLYTNNFQNDTIISRLNEILKILRGSGESTFEEPSTDSINDYNKAEEELVSGAEDTSDIEAEIGKVEINENASSVIWDIIQSFYNQNEKVFGLVISILCIGIIALILNR